MGNIYVELVLNLVLITKYRKTRFYQFQWAQTRMFVWSLLSKMHQAILDHQPKEESALHHELKNTILLENTFAMDKDQMGYQLEMSTKKGKCYNVDEKKQSVTYMKVVCDNPHHVHHVMSQLAHISIQEHIKLEIMIHKILLNIKIY